MLRRSPRRRGNILVLALVLLIVVFACVAFAIDVGYVSLLRTRLQVAADAGAMAGTDAMGDGAESCLAAAERFAELNFQRTDPLDVLPSEDIELGTWDEETREFRPVAVADFWDANAVRVTCRRIVARGTGANLFFAHLLGRRVADISAVAVARAKPSTCGRIIGLHRVAMSGSCFTDSYNSANGSYSSATPRQRGHVCSNGPILTSSSTRINGNGHPGHNHRIIGSGTVTGNNSPLSQTLSFPAPDPGTAEIQNDNWKMPLTSTGSPALSGGQLYLDAGANLDLPAGLYYFTGLNIASGATLRVNGPTVMYVDGNCSFSGGAMVNVSQKPSHLQLYCTGSTCTISGTTDFHGVIYAPGTRIIRSGSSHIFGMVLGRELILSGSGGIHADEALGQLKGLPNRYTVLVD